MLFADDMLEGIALEIVKSVYIADELCGRPLLQCFTSLFLFRLYSYSGVACLWWQKDFHWSRNPRISSALQQKYITWSAMQISSDDCGSRHRLC